MQFRLCCQVNHESWKWEQKRGTDGYEQVTTLKNLICNKKFCWQCWVKCFLLKIFNSNWKNTKKIRKHTCFQFSETKSICSASCSVKRLKRKSSISSKGFQMASIKAVLSMNKCFQCLKLCPKNGLTVTDRNRPSVSIKLLLGRTVNTDFSELINTLPSVN